MPSIALAHCGTFRRRLAALLPERYDLGAIFSPEEQHAARSPRGSLCRAIRARKHCSDGIDCAAATGVLSPDGKWVAYDFRRGNSSVELRYRGIGAPTETAVPSGSAPQFTSNSLWLVYTLAPDTAGGRGGRGGGRGGRSGGGATASVLPTRNKVGAVDLRTGQAREDGETSFFPCAGINSDGSEAKCQFPLVRICERR